MGDKAAFETANSPKNNDGLYFGAAHRRFLGAERCDPPLPIFNEGVRRLKTNGRGRRCEKNGEGFSPSPFFEG